MKLTNPYVESLKMPQQLYNPHSPFTIVLINASSRTSTAWFTRSHLSIHKPQRTRPITTIEPPTEPPNHTSCLPSTIAVTPSPDSPMLADNTQTARNLSSASPARSRTVFEQAIRTGARTRPTRSAHRVRRNIRGTRGPSGATDTES